MEFLSGRDETETIAPGRKRILMVRTAERLPDDPILMQTKSNLAFCTEISANNQVHLYEPVSLD
jgi:hypothetical protein